MTRVKKFVLGFLIFLLRLFFIFLFYYLISKLIYSFFTVREKVLYNLLGLLSFLIATAVFTLVNKKFLKKEKDKLLTVIVMAFLIDQYMILLMTPASFMMPNKMLMQLNILESAEYDGYCENKTEFEKGKFFMKDDMDTKSVRLYYIGNSIFTYPTKFIPISSGLYAHQENIYMIFGKAGCLSGSSAVHELTHIWQLQKRTSKGIDSIKKEINNTFFYFVDRKALYDYGEEKDLLRAKEEGKSFRDFNSEQQARMVEDYYTIKNEKIKFFRDELEPLLHYFLEPEFNFAKDK